MYYIDPNEGSYADAVEVFCDARTKSSCVLPVQDTIPIANYKPVSDWGHSWFSEINDGFSVSMCAGVAVILTVCASSSTESPLCSSTFCSF